VFLAHETSLKRMVVVKVLPSEMAGEVSADRFKREIALAATLQHPHIVPLLTAGDAGGLPYFTMPYVRGESLRARLTSHGELPVNEAMRILREVASALAFAHDAGVVHRDIKPDNVLISGGAAMVTDFGVAKAVSSSTTAATITSIGVALGTPAYMAPEQATADPLMDHRADIYAWGVLAYELLTGSTPFAGRLPQAMLAAHVQEEPEHIAKRRANLPAPLCALVMRCLSKRAADRPQHALELVRSLDEMVTPSAGLAPAEVRPRVMRRWVVAAAAIVVIAAALFTSQRLGTRSAAPRSIAVLPFENKSGDTAFDYLAEGMSDELRSQLTRVPGLAVMARSSSSAFKGPTADARDVGAKLKVASILQGSVGRARGRLHVTAELVRTEDGTALWSESFDRDTNNLSSIRDSVTHAVASALRLGATAPTRAARDEDPIARDYYLRGHYLSMKSDEASLRQSLVYFGKALERDATLAEAEAGIAWTWAFLADAYLSPAEAYPKTKVAALKAIALDSLLPEGHLALAMALGFHDWDYVAAERSIRRAVGLRPQYAEAHSTYGVVLCAMGRFAEAIAQVDSAVQLDPLATVPGFQRAWVLYTAGRYRDVIAQTARTNEIDSQQLYFEPYEGFAYRELGIADSALAAFERAKPLADGRPFAGLGILYARQGRAKEATDIAHALEEWSRHHYYPPEYIAAVWASVGNLDRAFTWLGKVFEVRSSLWLAFSAGAEFAPLRKDPRWAALERRARGQ
jgi:serine/threonine-protein kinase